MSKRFAAFLVVFGLAGPAIVGPVSASWAAGALGADPSLFSAAGCTIGGISLVAFLAAAILGARGAASRWWRPAVVAGAILSGSLAVLAASPAAGIILALDIVLAAIAVPSGNTPSRRAAGAAS